MSMSALLWKEWREQRWRLGFGCVLLMGFTAISLRSHMVPDDVTLAMVLLLGGFFLPLLAAIGVLGTEREEQSLAFLSALPVRPRAVLAAKTVMGLATLLLPIAGVLGLTLLIASERDMGTLVIVSLMGATAWIAIHAFVWTIAFGATQPTEARVGVVGIAVLAAWFSYLAGADTIVHGLGFRAAIIPIPVGLINMIDVVANLDLLAHTAGSMVVWIALAAVVVQTALLILLWLWAAARISTLRRHHS